MKTQTNRYLSILCVLTTFIALAATAAQAPAETAQQREARMKWWREARFGMFIHWSPNSLTGKELSWSRKGSKPMDITGDPAGYVEDPVYDNLYKQFNPTNYDARQWVKIAQDAGMKYMVLTCKHHEGFSMFHTEFSDYSIANSPFKRDIVKELAEACHEAGMGFGAYYSPRDWHHPDYLMGDNREYNVFMMGQLRELLSHYGKVDILWFDSFGRSDLLKDWDVPGILRMAHELQPGVVINNRLAILGAYNSGPREFWGDFDTPEQSISRMQTNRPWESCMCLVGRQWSYKPGGIMKSAEEVIHDLVSCATGDGNLLLDVGPMPTGEIEPRQAARLKEVGDWLKQYGQSIYGTRGGPLRNRNWGGTTYRDNIIYLHVFEWPGDTMRLNPIQERITAARVLTGGEVIFTQDEAGIGLSMPGEQHDKIDTIIELTLERR
jgi:alpha-L-fucosidase